MYLNLDLLYLIKDFYFKKCELYFHEKFDHFIIFNDQINKGILVFNRTLRVRYIHIDWNDKFHWWDSVIIIRETENYKKIKFGDFDFNRTARLKSKNFILSELLEFSDIILNI